MTGIAMGINTIIMLLSFLIAAPVTQESSSVLKPSGHDSVAIIVGQAGSNRYRMKYQEYVEDIYGMLHQTYGYPEDRIFVFTENGGDMGLVPAAGQAAPGSLEWLFKEKVGNDQSLLLILIGHTNIARDDIYFHTRSSPITASGLGEVLSGHPGPVSIIAATPHAGGWIDSLAGPDRVIIASSKKSQRYQPGFLTALVISLENLSDQKNELTLGDFTRYLQEEVDRFYAENNLLKTEHMVIWPADKLDTRWRRLLTYQPGKFPREEKTPVQEEIHVRESMKRDPSYWRKSANSFPGDDDSPVAILYDRFAIEFGERMDGRSLHHRVMLIHREEGRDLARVSFPFNTKETGVELEWARTIQPDGRVVECDRERDLQYVPGPAGVYHSTVTCSLYFPAVEPGSIVEYCFRRKWKPGGISSMSSRLLQTPYPTDRFLYEVSVPEKSDLNVRFSNLPPGCHPRIKKDKYVITRSVEGKGLPNLTAETMAPPVYTIGISVSISEYKTWEEIAGWYARIAIPRTEPTGVIRELADSITDGLKNDEEKIEKIYGWITDKIRYIHVPLGDHSYQPFPAERTFEQGYGDCKDKAALMISLLKSVDLDAYFALINTGDAPLLIPSFPTRAFNHVIVAIPDGAGSFQLIDPTSATTPFGVLPLPDQGRKVLIVDPARPEIMECPATEPMGNLVTIDQSYSAADELMTVSWSARGDVLQTWRIIKKILPAKRARERILFRDLGLNPLEYRIKDMDETQLENDTVLRLKFTLTPRLPYLRIKWTDYPANRLKYTDEDRTQPYYLKTGFGYRERIHRPGRAKESRWEKSVGPLNLEIRVEPGKENSMIERRVMLSAGRYSPETYARFFRALMEFEKESRRLVNK